MYLIVYMQHTKSLSVDGISGVNNSNEVAKYNLERKLRRQPFNLPLTIVQPYLALGGSVHTHLIHHSLTSRHSASQTAAQSVQPFLRGRCCILPMCYIMLPFFPIIAFFHKGFELPSDTSLFWPTWSTTSNGNSVESVFSRASRCDLSSHVSVVTK